MTHQPLLVLSRHHTSHNNSHKHKYNHKNKYTKNAYDDTCVADDTSVQEPECTEGVKEYIHFLSCCPPPGPSPQQILCQNKCKFQCKYKYECKYKRESKYKHEYKYTNMNVNTSTVWMQTQVLMQIHL